ncbi:hypothetical protein ACJZ2D_010626 [Fusarium nematophilum]
MASMLKALQDYKLPDSITGFGGEPSTAMGTLGRLNAFVEHGVSDQFKGLASKLQKCVVHADFTTNNLLFDKESGSITALLDYDFAFISHPWHEFLRSFDGDGGQLRGWTGHDDTEQAALREWERAKSWEQELEKAGAKRPRTIQGIENVADVDTVLHTTLP